MAGHKGIGCSPVSMLVPPSGKLLLLASFKQLVSPDSGSVALDIGPRSAFAATSNWLATTAAQWFAYAAATSEPALPMWNTRPFGAIKLGFTNSLFGVADRDPIDHDFVAQ